MYTDKERKFLLLLLSAMAIWGFSWSAGKIAVGGATPEEVLLWRFILTFFSYIPVILIFRSPLRIKGKVFLKLIAASAAYTLYNVFFLLGLESGAAGAGGVLVTTLNPILTFLFVIPFQQKLPKKIEIGGLLLGFLGGFFLLGGRNVSLDSLMQSGNLYFILASASWTLVSFSSRILRHDVDGFAYGYYVYGISVFFSLIYTGLSPLSGVFNADLSFWLSLIYIAIISTTFGTTIYFFAAARLGSARASSFIFLVPITAMLGAMLFLGEFPGWKTVTGGILAIFAVMILNRSESNNSVSKDAGEKV